MAAQNPRPLFFEGQYLSASDLAAVVDYLRTGDARHALGGHSWGIALGLDLIERNAPGAANRKEVILLPGLAWDGFGRIIAVTQPTRLPEELFQSIPFDSADDPADPDGRLVKVWLNYKETGANPPAAGFQTCDDQMARAQEGFELVVGDFSPEDQHRNVAIGPDSVEASQAVKHFYQALIGQAAATTSDGSAEGGPFTLWNTSVPHQAFPLTGRPPRWLIPVGLVRWVAGQNSLGYFLDREHLPEVKVQDKIRAFRRYVGLVAESIEAAAGAIVLRRRGEDPNGTHRFLNLLQGSQGADKLLSDLVWVEGNLRALGDVRLAGSRLVFLEKDGTDLDIPLYLDRQGDDGKDSGQRKLRVILGDDKQPDNVFVVGPLQGAEPQAGPDLRQVAPNLLVTSGGTDGGRVGVNIDAPEHTLHVRGQRIRMDKGNDTRIDLRVDDVGAVGLYSDTSKLRIRSSGALGKNPVVINPNRNPNDPDGDGAVGIGIDNPQYDLDVKAKNIKLGLEADGGGQLRLRHDDIGDNEVIAEVSNSSGDGPASELRFVGPQNKDLSLLSAHAETTYLTGKLGVGIDTPDTQVHVRGPRIRLESVDRKKRIDLRCDDPSSVVLQSETNSLCIRSPKHHIVMNDESGDGNVGIGTAGPTAKLHVAGDAIVEGKLTVGATGVKQPLHVVGSRLLVDGDNNEQAYFGNDMGLAHPDHVHLGSLNFKVKQVCLMNPNLTGTDKRMNLYCRGIKCHDIDAFYFYFSSDARLKKDVASISGSLDRVRRLRGVSFQWKGEPTTDETHGDSTVQSGVETKAKAPARQLGLLAQEVAKVIPEAVTTAANGELAISMTALFPVLIESIKELKAEVDDLRSQLAAQAPRKGGKPK